MATKPAAGTIWLNVIAQKSASAATIAASQASDIPLREGRGRDRPRKRQARGGDNQRRHGGESREPAEHVVGARQIERDEDIEHFVVELARHRRDDVHRHHENRCPARGPGVEPGAEARPLGDRDLLDEEAGGHEERQHDQNDRRQARAPGLQQGVRGDGRGA